MADWHLLCTWPPCEAVASKPCGLSQKLDGTHLSNVWAASHILHKHILLDALVIWCVAWPLMHLGIHDWKLQSTHWHLRILFSEKQECLKTIGIPHLAADLHKDAQGVYSSQLSTHPHPSLAIAVELAHKSLEGAFWVIVAEHKGLPVSAGSVISWARSVDLSSLQ